MLELKNIAKEYKQEHGIIHALADINLTIEKGTFTTITGSSGSGKTTLLLLLGGLIKPTRGTIKFSGNELYSLSPKKIAEYRNKKVGFVLQTFHLIPYLTALENVEVPMMLGKTDKTKQKQIAEGILAKLGLSDRINHLPRELSVGQQQRVAIARALANNPEIILADEPTGNLDPTLSTEILTILKQLNDDEGRTVIMVTHNPEASKFGTHNLKIENGRIV
jgi:putative ABC transport system ATP-binding protein